MKTFRQKLDRQLNTGNEFLNLFIVLLIAGVISIPSTMLAIYFFGGV